MHLKNFDFCSKVEFRILEVMLELAVSVNQVGNGNVAVVSPPGPYDNMAGGDQQCGQAPPDYAEGSEDGVFSDAAIRRGEG